jgi:glycosyltransferase involved in cell wall biosynthesis
MKAIEVIIVDGGSTDDTFEVIKNYNKKLIIKLFKTGIKDQEPKRAIGIEKASGKYIASIDPDVYLTDKKWLTKMINPLEIDKSLVGSQTLYYEYSKEETAINRYFALFGINDPVAFYLNKADRIPYFENKWLFNKNFVDKKTYFEVNFERNIPTMGCNGVVFRSSIYKKFANKKTFFHIDIIQDMVDSGYKKFAIVKNSVLHSTGETFCKSIVKRVNYMNLHFHKRRGERRYLVFDINSKRDVFNLVKFVFYTLTIVQPIYLSIKGYRKIKDIAWFLHWPVSMGFLVAYSIANTRTWIKMNING